MRSPPRPTRLFALLASCLVAALAACGQPSVDHMDSVETHSHALIEDLGNHILADVERAVRPAIERATEVASRDEVAAALARGDSAALTRLANAVVTSARDVDVLVFFDAAGSIVAISDVYTDGRPVPRERVARLLGADLSERSVVANCLSNGGASAALEFQTQCDITPAWFDSAGLSVAYSTPVVDPRSGERVGVVGARLRSERLSAVLAEGVLANGRHSIHFVTESGQYLDEDIQRGAAPPLLPAELAGLVAPVASGRVQSAQADVVVDGRDARVTILPLESLATLEGGGLGVMLIADRDWVEAEAHLASLESRVLLGTTLVLLVLLFGGTCVIWLERRRRRELTVARDAAQASERAKSTFLAHMSHEIRTPLTAILGFSEAIAQSRDLDEVRDHAATILRNGQSLLAILDDVLDLSKIEADRITLRIEPCSPRDLVGEVLSLFELRSREKGVPLVVEFAGDVVPALATDALRLRQIVSNLVSNALKFTTRGEVRVRVATPAVGPGRVALEISVTDTGVGIAPDDQERLFQPFVQADVGARRRFGGTGLGLVISRRFAQLLGGSLDLVSELGRGSTFTLRLPAELAELPATPALAGPAASDQPLAGRTILVVDDGADNRRLLGAILRRAGARCDEASDGREAVELALAEPRRYDAVLMDVQMPVLDGLSATRELIARGFAAPILAVSAGALEEERQACREAGCRAFLSKPLRREELLAELVRSWSPARAAA